MIDRFFSGRSLYIATKHQKERVLQPILEQALGVNVEVASVDTDVFGTFSGEIERSVTALETARKKCTAVHESTGATLVLASEGSFGAHPVMGFVPAAEELLLLKDFELGTEYRAKVISTSTNFSGGDYYEWVQVLFFASQVSFPSHGLIVRKNKDDYSEIYKGITEWTQLKSAFHHFVKKYGHAYIETDMRAMYNPTRMKVIREAAEKLVNVIHSACPVCESPGFDVKEVIKGLPCGFCNTPTQTAKAYLYQCQFCNHTETRQSHTAQKENPMFCDECNP